MSDQQVHDETGGSPKDAKAELRSYVIGFVVALPLTIGPFAFVAWDLAARPTALVVIGVAAVAQIAAHFRWFLHITFRGQSREDLQLILFTTLILILMGGGTIWILANLEHRMQ